MFEEIGLDPVTDLEISEEPDRDYKVPGSTCVPMVWSLPIYMYW
jgi:hypothetical protein